MRIVYIIHIRCSRQISACQMVGQKHGVGAEVVTVRSVALTQAGASPLTSASIPITNAKNVLTTIGYSTTVSGRLSKGGMGYLSPSVSSVGLKIPLMNYSLPTCSSQPSFTR